MWIKDNTFYNTSDEIRRACPNTSFPSYITDEMIADAGFTPVTELPAPDYDPATQRIEQTAPAEVDGIWTRGWTVIDLTPEEIEAKRKAAVPIEISMRQARLALHGAGLLASVETAVAQSTKDVQIEWEFAADLRRDWPTLVALSAALGLTDEQVDGLFMQAAQL